MTPLEHLRAAMTAVDAYYKQQGIFQGHFGFGKKPALIVIDMAYGWTDPPYAGGWARLDPAMAAIGQLLPPARAKGIPIIYTTSPFTDKPAFKSAADYSPNFRKWDQRACEIDERVRPLPGERILYKDYASGFAGTPLAGLLMEHGIDTLLITGCSTSACVRATATDAKTYHLKPLIIREAGQERSEGAHEWTLFGILTPFPLPLRGEE